MLSIKILGFNHPFMDKIEEHTRTAMGWLRPHAGYRIEKVTDEVEINAYTNKSLGLIINNKIVSEGQIPAVNEVVMWASDALQTALESREH